MTKIQLMFQTIISPLFAENTYIAHLPGRKECVVVDPGIDPQAILDALSEADLQPTAILNTHGHADHIAGNGALKAAFPAAPLIIGQGDAYKLTDAEANLSAGYGMPIVSPHADRTVSESDQIEFGGIEFDVLETPGHSPGHVVFVYKSASPWIVLGGDVLFQGSIGRTDFPDGSFDDLAASIHEKLFTMPDDTIVLPGHGDSTTIGDEKAMNPFVGVPSGYRAE